MSYTKPFEVEHLDFLPQWNSSDPLIPLFPAGTTPYQGRVGDFVDYDGYVAYSTAGYTLAHVGPYFYAVVRPVRFEGGRSAANIRLKDMNRDKTFLMSATTYIEEIQKSSLGGGRLKGKFKFVKKGSNYRVELVEQD